MYSLHTHLQRSYPTSRTCRVHNNITASYRHGTDVCPDKLFVQDLWMTAATLWRYTQGLTTRWAATLQQRRNLLNGVPRSALGWRHTGTPREIHEGTTLNRERLGGRETHTTAPATRGKESRILPVSPLWSLALAVFCSLTVPQAKTTKDAKAKHNPLGPREGTGPIEVMGLGRIDSALKSISAACGACAGLDFKAWRV